MAKRVRTGLLRSDILDRYVERFHRSSSSNSVHFSPASGATPRWTTSTNRRKI